MPACCASFGVLTACCGTSAGFEEHAAPNISAAKIVYFI
jgi:hypothetical protein